MSDDSASHDRILIISENPSGVSELSRQLAWKGYKTFKAPPFADLKYLDRRHPALIVIVDCPDTCLFITEHLRLNCGISDIPVICIGDRVCSGKPSNLEQIITGEFMSKSAAFDALESRIRFCLHNKHTLRAESLPEPAFHERREFDRRKCERRMPVNLTEQNQAADQESGIAQSVLVEPLSAEENNDSITLSLVSQRGHLFDLLQTHFNDTPAISLFKTCINSLALIPDRLEQLHPDLLLVDTALSGPAVSEWLTAIRKTDPKVRIVLCYDDATPDLINEIIEFGISGLITTHVGCDVFRKAVRTVHTGELWLPHRLISQIIAVYAIQNSLPERTSHIDLHDIVKTSLLTQREQCIIELIAQGMTNKQIAKQLFLSPETIKKKLANIFAKTGVHNRSQLVSIYAASLKDLFAKKLE
ncbi:MAG: response regulator transcription factor [Methylococcales bacterium]|nr:response regulator transcription factor [Methylococcales bacterium]